jgi:hypothetical protein
MESGVPGQRFSSYAYPLAVDFVVSDDTIKGRVSGILPD